MKKKISGAVVLLAGAFTAYSQGTLSLGNYGDLGTYVYVSLLRYRLSPPYTTSVLLGGSSSPTTGNPNQDIANGDDWTVALYGNAGWNDPANTLVQLYTVKNFFYPAGLPAATTLADGSNDKTTGTWYWDNSEIVGAPGTTSAGQPFTLQLYAWYNDGGRINSYSAALADGYPAGFSTTANTLTGGPNPNGQPSLPLLLPTFQYGGGSIEIMTGVIPEPNTIALGILGASAFLCLRTPRSISSTSDKR